MRRARVAAWLPPALVAAALLVTASGALLGAALPDASAAAEVLISTDTGQALAFEPAVATAPADSTVRVVFTNASTIAHNLTFQAPLSGGTRTIVEPGATDVVLLRTPGPGSYSFVCTIHMDMSGTIEVR
jgi:plastocyanin